MTDIQETQSLADRARHFAKFHGSIFVRTASDAEKLQLVRPLVEKAYRQRGYAFESDNHWRRHDIAISLVAFDNGIFCGTLTIRIDSYSGLAADEVFQEQLDAARKLKEQICELTKLAVVRGSNNAIVLAALISHACQIATLFDCDTAFIEVNPRHRRFYEETFGFAIRGEIKENRRVKAPACLLFVSVRDVERKVAAFYDCAVQRKRLPTRQYRNRSAGEFENQVSKLEEKFEVKSFNANGLKLQRIFGADMPEGAVSCSTQDGVMSFLIGESRQFVKVRMTPTQEQAVKEAGLLDTFGRDLV